jgi:transcription termination factor Rho
MTDPIKTKSTTAALPLETPAAPANGKPAKKTVRRKTATATATATPIKRAPRKKTVKAAPPDAAEPAQAILAISEESPPKPQPAPVVEAPVAVVVAAPEVPAPQPAATAPAPAPVPPKEEISTSEMLRRLHANDPRPRRQEQQHPRNHDYAQPAPAVEQPRQEPVFGEGIIEVSGKGFGFLRDPKRNFVQSPLDIFVTPEVVRKFALRDGQWLRGEIRRGGRGPQLYRLTTINGEDADKFKSAPAFEELTTINPNKRIKLETVPDRYTTRIMDMMTPLGKGQRGLIVAPPRTGKTTLLEHIADAVAKNHPEMKLIILLVDERPEEVTEIRRSCPTADIMASSNDSDIKSHTRISQLAIERAKRLVEEGKDVFILLDSITRVARAFNNSTTGGRTMSGGIDARAMEIPRRLFSAARNTEEAGSLTIVATALIETGSRMDELIFQEFKGTGNMELVLDRKISDLRVYPAVDIFKSGTRREELLLPADQLHKINVIRRGLSGHKPEEAIERLLMFVKKFPTNTQMLNEIPG